MNSCKSISNKKSFLAGLIVYLGHRRWPWSKANGLERCSHREKPIPRTQDRLKVPKNPVILSKSLRQFAKSADKKLRALVPLWQKYLCVLSVLGGKKEVNQQNKNMRNEPNLHRDKITHFINDQRTMNNEHCTNEPNFAQRTSSISYPESRFEQKMSNEPNPVLSEVEWIKQITHFINEQRTMNNELLSNEPNLEENKANFKLTGSGNTWLSFFCFGRSYKVKNWFLLVSFFRLSSVQFLSIRRKVFLMVY